MSWVEDIVNGLHAARYAKMRTQMLYGNLPENDDALTSKSYLGYVCNSAGIASAISTFYDGNILAGALRITAPILSAAGDTTGRWVAKLQNQAVNTGEVPKNKFLHWALSHRLAVNYIPKIAGATALLFSGAERYSLGHTEVGLGYMASGTFYIATNSMKGFGNRKTMLTSTIMSGIAGAFMLASGCVQNGKITDIIGGASGIGMAVLMSRIDPAKMKIAGRG